MKTNNGANISESIRLEYEAARSTFHTVLNSLSEDDMRAKSHNPGWTNGEILFHLTFGFIILSSLLPLAKFFGHLPKFYSQVFAGILNSMTWFFNRVNQAGARSGGRLYSRQSIGYKFDKTINGLIKKSAAIEEREWQSGMYYPTKWDSLFSRFMTLEKLFHYPVIHMQFHLDQIKPWPIATPSR